MAVLTKIDPSIRQDNPAGPDTFSQATIGPSSQRASQLTLRDSLREIALGRGPNSTPERLGDPNSILSILSKPLDQSRALLQGQTPETVAGYVKFLQDLGQPAKAGRFEMTTHTVNGQQYQITSAAAAQKLETLTGLLKDIPA